MNWKDYEKCSNLAVVLCGDNSKVDTIFTELLNYKKGLKDSIEIDYRDTKLSKENLEEILESFMEN